MRCILLTLIFSSISNNFFSQKAFFDSINKELCIIDKYRKYEYCKCYDLYGKITKEGSLKKNIKVNNWKFYFDGLLQQEGRYKNNLKIGFWREYYISGKEIFIGKYVTGKKNGTWKLYSSPVDLRGKKININQLKYEHYTIYFMDSILKYRIKP